MSADTAKPIEQKIIEALVFYKRPDLARLLKGVTYELNVSSTYGRAYNSLRTSVEVYSDIQTHEALLGLDEGDREDVLKAFHVVYPIQEGAPDLNWMEFFIDPNLPIPTGRGVEIGLDGVDLAFIAEQVEKCEGRLAEADYDGALTNAKSLLETVLKHILDTRDVGYEDSEDALKLYRKAATVLKMNPADYEDDCFKKVLSGFFSIVQGVSEARNALSDAHGRSSRRKYRLERRHAKLVVDSAKTIADFMLRSFQDGQGAANDSSLLSGDTGK
jgi:hypothetical protein